MYIRQCRRGFFERRRRASRIQEGGGASPLCVFEMLVGDATDPAERGAVEPYRERGVVAARLNDWVDEPVEVEFVTREEDSGPQQTRYTLEGAGEGGILLGYVDERDLSSDYQILFYPWHRIKRIHLLTPIVGS